MCGIAGVAFRDSKQASTRQFLQPMCDVMRHRGPNDEGYWTGEGAGLCMRRLSIIDLAGGHQPIANEDGTVHVVLNGEIYNFQELRTQLEAKGHRFRTQSDTEAIVHLYEEHGEACVEFLRGMFAFALWDQRKGRLLLARDRLGKKPLHYALLGDRLLFASEMKSILACRDVPRAVDPVSLDQFLTFEYVPGERTLFKSIRRLLPGHRLVWEQGRMQIDAYWRLAFEPDTTRSLASWADELRDTLRESVRLRLISDVPLGVLLSGGIDSSALVALMRQTTSGDIRTFSIGFEDQSYNELVYARLIAKRFETRHEEFMVKPDATTLAQRLVDHFDEPFADVSAIPTFLVCSMAQQRVTVALGGDGGDELFGGYDAYLAQAMAGRYAALPALLRRCLIEPAATALRPTSQKKGLVNRIKRFTEGMQHPQSLGHARWMVFLTEREKERLYTPALREQIRGLSGYEPVLAAAARYQALDPLSRAMAVDIATYLPDDILVKVDRMSMATSLEVRAPLLDHRVVELAARIPSAFKIRGSETKVVFREAMRPLLPAETLAKPKQGFSIPIKNWLRGELRDMLRSYLAAERLARHGYVSPPLVQRWVREHLNGSQNHAHRLWCLMMLEMWHERYIDG
jgi:asparagine synthase (glutamine-hydrolysing)